MSGSLLNAGLAPSRRVLSGPPGSCVVPKNDTGNHFTFERSGASVLSDDLVIAVLDGGTVDARGNRFVPNSLASGSPCIDQGRYSLRSTGEPVFTDIEGKPRDAGLRPDIGCFER